LLQHTHPLQCCGLEGNQKRHSVLKKHDLTACSYPVSLLMIQ
jgi:hypothetical protein